VRNDWGIVSVPEREARDEGGGKGWCGAACVLRRRWAGAVAGRDCGGDGCLVVMRPTMTIMIRTTVRNTDNGMDDLVVRRNYENTGIYPTLRYDHRRLVQNIVAEDNAVIE